MTRVLVVEDEQDLAGLLLYNLRAAGYEVEAVASGATAIARLPLFRPDLVLLDLMLPDVSGLEVARAVRQGPYPGTGIVMLTARGSETDRIRGLELGADDYVLKPFSVRELLLRIQAVLRRLGGEQSEAAAPLEVGPIRLDEVRHDVQVDGKVVALTALEFRLLKTFLQRRGRIQSRETLLADVWNITADVETRTVDSHVKRLRQKLGPAGALLETVRGVGYRLGGDGGGEGGHD